MEGAIDSARGAFVTIDSYLAHIGVFGDTRYYWYVMIGIVVIVLLVPRSKKYDLATMLELENFEMEQAGIHQSNRMRSLFCDRPDWGNLPEPILFELATRFGDDQSVIDFLVLVHRHGLFKKRLIGLEEKKGSEEFFTALSHGLAKVVRKGKDDAELAQYLMNRVNCASPEPALSVARYLYRRKRYEAALPFIESAMQSCQRMLDLVRSRPAVEVEKPGFTRKTNAKLAKVIKLYERCLDRAKPAEAAA